MNKNKNIFIGTNIYHPELKDEIIVYFLYCHGVPLFANSKDLINRARKLEATHPKTLHNSSHSVNKPA